MRYKHNKDLTTAAKELRKNMTKEEKRLWYGFLQQYPVRFYRQKVLGYYVADFYCARAKLVIELDGSQHHEDPVLQYDAQRTEFLSGYGLFVLRIPNENVNSYFDGVCMYIDQLVKQRLANNQ